mmetsp:Transcript_95153/g.268872  ORF Transcript_95153/g.268872 Transcript_95153/m.268872 type:complete len:202 (-) Transcript_95153:719-1324(-)
MHSKLLRGVLLHRQVIRFELPRRRHDVAYALVPKHPGAGEAHGEGKHATKQEEDKGTPCELPLHRCWISDPPHFKGTCGGVEPEGALRLFHSIPEVLRAALRARIAAFEHDHAVAAQVVPGVVACERTEVLATVDADCPVVHERMPTRHHGWAQDGCDAVDVPVPVARRLEDVHGGVCHRRLGVRIPEADHGGVGASPRHG